MNDTPDPRFVVIAGDWHGNLKWALHVINQAAELFTRASESRRIIIQLGDFGWCPIPENHELQWMNDALAERDMELWWIDGNHDFHLHIQQLMKDWRYWNPNSELRPIALPGLTRIRYLPRGTRWTWADRIWLAVGGAVSVDQLELTEGVDWWPEEEISDAEEQAIIASGPADILLSHDCPDSWVPFDKMIPLDEIRWSYPHWIPMLPQARLHSARLERIARAAGVTRVFHGHYHVSRDDHYTDAVLGDVHVTGLTLDGYAGNFQMIDVGRVHGGLEADTDASGGDRIPER